MSPSRAGPASIDYYKNMDFRWGKYIDIGDNVFLYFTNIRFIFFMLHTIVHSVVLFIFNNNNKNIGLCCISSSLVGPTSAHNSQ